MSTETGQFFSGSFSLKEPDLTPQVLKDDLRRPFETSEDGQAVTDNEGRLVRKQVRLSTVVVRRGK